MLLLLPPLLLLLLFDSRSLLQSDTNIDSRALCRRFLNWSTVPRTALITMRLRRVMRPFQGRFQPLVCVWNGNYFYVPFIVRDGWLAGSGSGSRGQSRQAQTE
uniref:Putative secreted protein n=1 Tax=Anopheles marajoara TaxID=58244 RepID=A0A2M4C8S9_9DIPT